MENGKIVDEKVVRGALPINAAAALEHGAVYSESGYATKELADILGVTVSNLQSASKRLRDEGLVESVSKGKRTYALALTDKGKEWLDKHRDKATYNRSLQELSDSSVQVPAVDGTVDDQTVQATTVADERTVGKPGRVAARLEKQIPSIIEASVNAAIANVLVSLAERLGFGNTDELQSQVSLLEDTVAAYEQRFEAMEEELRWTRNEMHTAQQERNTALLHSERGKREGQGLSVSDLHDLFRDIGASFIRQGGRIYGTRGGHLLWMWTDGRRAYSAKTPSDWRSARNQRTNLKLNTGWKDEEGTTET
jgi:DNA-binding MarR family transcriptional regulator